MLVGPLDRRQGFAWTVGILMIMAGFIIGGIVLFTPSNGSSLGDSRWA